MKSSILVLSLALSLGTISAAVAQDDNQSQPQGGHGAFMQACGADMQTYCPNAQSREDRRSCIDANKDKFSDSCKNFMANRHMHQHRQMQGPGSGQ